jgi:hypothetical protein
MMMFKEYNPNPSGRSDLMDCVVRALCAVLDKPWRTIYVMLCLQGFRYFTWGNSDAVWGAYLRSLRWRREVIPNTCPDCYTMEQFAQDHPEGVYVVFTGNHVATIRNGWLLDAWDSSKEVPVFYWQKEE